MFFCLPFTNHAILNINTFCSRKNALILTTIFVFFGKNVNMFVKKNMKNGNFNIKLIIAKIDFHICQFKKKYS